MAHLIQPLINNPDNPQNLEDYFQSLKSAHDYLVSHAQKALDQVAKAQDVGRWASLAKRIQLQFPDELRPLYISPKMQSHNLIEVINQCATMERLLDALQWSIQNLSDYQVLRCHPTTSSDKSNKANTIPDNDLILMNKLGQLARFEVSDVVNNKGDSNGKQKKDLASLGILKKVGNNKYEASESWPLGRAFLVVSSEFSHVLRKNNAQRTYRYEENPVGESTVVVEIHPT
jgi:hypothetical protein